MPPFSLYEPFILCLSMLGYMIILFAPVAVIALLVLLWRLRHKH